MGVDEKYDVKRTVDVVIEGKNGIYVGEHSKANGTPEGWGVFFLRGSFLGSNFGHFENGKLSRDHKSITISNGTACFKNWYRTRPGEKKLSLGVLYQEDGTRSSALFSENNVLEMPFKLKSFPSDDFLDMG